MSGVTVIDRAKGGKHEYPMMLLLLCTEPQNPLRGKVSHPRGDKVEAISALLPCLGLIGLKGY